MGQKKFHPFPFASSATAPSSLLRGCRLPLLSTPWPWPDPRPWRRPMDLRLHGHGDPQPWVLGQPRVMEEREGQQLKKQRGKGRNFFASRHGMILAFHCKWMTMILIREVMARIDYNNPPIPTCRILILHYMLTLQHINILGFLTWKSSSNTEVRITQVWGKKKNL